MEQKRKKCQTKKEGVFLILYFVINITNAEMHIYVRTYMRVNIILIK